MSWSTVHDDLFIKEVILFEPWKYRKGSPERGNAWKAIADSLNQIPDPRFKVEDRSVRDRYKLLEKKYIQKRNDDEKASGVEVEEETDFDKGLGDIVHQFREQEILQNEDKTKKNNALEQESRQAEEFRKQSLETFGESSRRRCDESGDEKRGRKRRSDDGIEFLKEKYKQEVTLRQDELRVKEKELCVKNRELDDRRAEAEGMQRAMLQQQQQTAELLQQQMQQQQQMNNVLLQILMKKQ